jgi:methyl-accepting chemotaxis protein
MFRNVRDLLSGELRRELQQRVDELLEATADTNDTIDKLRESIDRLTAALQKCERPDPAALAALKSASEQWRAAADRMHESATEVVKAMKHVEDRVDSILG